MVRRWSYIGCKNNTLFDITSTSLGASIENHTFKVFRKTTFFRKYNRGIASFVRRKNIHRKRKTNNVFLNYITANWVRLYLRSRRIYRYIQTNYLFSTARGLSSVESFITKAKSSGFLSGALITTIPADVIKTSTALKSHNSRNALVYTPTVFDKKDIVITNMLLNSYILGEHSFYSLPSVDSKSTVNSIASLLTKKILSTAISLRHVIVLCTLLNISNSN